LSLRTREEARIYHALSKTKSMAEASRSPTVVSCKLLSTPDPRAPPCGPLSVAREPYTVTVAPYVSELPVDAGALFGRRSAQERARRWRTASENHMREMGRVVSWMRSMQAALPGVTLGLADTGLGVQAFDSADPRRFVELLWDRLGEASIVASHKFLILTILGICEGTSTWTALERHGVDVSNGRVLQTTWLGADGVQKRVFFVRHCLSCANRLAEAGANHLGRRATACLEVDAILRSRCALREALGTSPELPRLFSSAQPRAMQTALALVSDAVDRQWLRRVAENSGMYTDCCDARFGRALRSGAPSSQGGRGCAIS